MERMTPAADDENWALSLHERATIAAAMARVIPTDEFGGAREAGTIDFLERYLSGTSFIYAKPDGSGFEMLTGKRRDAWRSRVAIMREKYRAGVQEVDGRSRHPFSRDFVDLSEEEQDAVLKSVEAGESWPETTLAPAYQVASTVAGGPALQQTSTEVELDFFPLLVVHTRQGFLADPLYGGNRGHVGWKAIGFPGPASLAEVHEGRYSSLAWFADGHTDPSAEKRETHHGA